MDVKRITEQYCRMPLPIKATAWFTICQFLQKGISLLTTPFVTRLLPTEEYGRVSTFVSWENIGMILITLSAGHAVMNLCVKYEKRERMLSSLVGYNILLSLLWVLLFLLTGNQILQFTGLSDTLLICLFLLCVFQSIINCWIYLKQYEYKYKAVVLQTLCYTFAASFGGLFAIVFFSRTAEAKIIPQTAAAAAIGLIVAVSTFKKGRVFYEPTVWKFTFGFCVPLLPHYFSEIILMSSDRIMIDRMCGSSDVAIYSVAYSVGSLISMVTGAVNSAFAPYQYQKITDREYRTLAKNTNYIIGFVAVCLCGVMLFGREVVLLFGGKKYLDSIVLIIPISLGVFFNYVFQLFARVQEYFEQKHTIVIASVSCAVLNIVLNYIFIGQYGYQAAAYTTFACYFAFCFLHYLFYRKACRRYVGQEIYDIKGLALISTALTAASVLIGLISRLYMLKYSILVAGLVIMAWQRKRVLSFIKMIRRK